MDALREIAPLEATVWMVLLPGKSFERSIKEEAFFVGPVENGGTSNLLVVDGSTIRFVGEETLKLFVVTFSELSEFSNKAIDDIFVDGGTRISICPAKESE